MRHFGTFTGGRVRRALRHFGTFTGGRVCKTAAVTRGTILRVSGNLQLNFFNQFFLELIPETFLCHLSPYEECEWQSLCCHSHSILSNLSLIFQRLCPRADIKIGVHTIANLGLLGREVSSADESIGAHGSSRLGGLEGVYPHKIGSFPHGI